MAGCDSVFLTSKAASVWAKHIQEKESGVSLWLPLGIHLSDAAGVAEKCYLHWLSKSQKTLLLKAVQTSFTPVVSTLHKTELQETTASAEQTFSSDSSEEKIISLIKFLAGVHDIGKATPTFAQKIPELYARMEEKGLQSRQIQKMEAQTLPHGLAGQIILNKFLLRQGFSIEAAKSLASVIGGHHGVSVSESEFQANQNNVELLGLSPWEKVQEELLDYIASITKWKENLCIFQNTKWSKAQLVMLQGILIMADWIASNTDFFPLFSLSSSSPRLLFNELSKQQERVEKGWSAVKLSASWAVQPDNETVQDLLVNRFGFPKNIRPRPIQEKAVDLAKNMDIPGILIIEDLMGSGKTEAALLAAEIIARRNGNSGVMVALPTQATTDAMLKRILRWLPRVAKYHQSDSYKGEEYTPTISLIHSKADFNHEYSNIPMINTEAIGAINFEGSFSDIYREESEIKESVQTQGIRIRRHEWMMSAKKALLADFTVSTIDQILMMALQSRYLTLRHLGITRKVVILDEIHSCDIYMTKFLERALEWLGAYGVPVIALSATLAPNVRQALVDAYENGLNSRDHQKNRIKRPPRPQTTINKKADFNVAREQNKGEKQYSIGEQEPGNTLIRGEKQQNVDKRVDLDKESTNHLLSYPCVTAKMDGNYLNSAVECAFPSKKIELGLAGWEDATEIAGSLIKTGGNILVIHNTVGRAQETYRELKKLYGDIVRLVHSRFTIQDRVENDRWLLETYGRSRAVKRPKISITVATQVVEQSLDIDFDAIITDIAPIDLLYQRVGRIHRHQENTRPKLLQIPKCIVLGCPSVETDNLLGITSINKNIYPPLWLLKTADLLNEIAAIEGTLTLPNQVAEHIAWVYGEQPVKNQYWKNTYHLTYGKNENQEHREKDLADQFLLAGINEYPRDNLNDWLSFRSEIDETKVRAAVRLGEENLEVILVEESVHDQEIIWKLVGTKEENKKQIVPRNRVPDWNTTKQLLLSKIRLPAGLTIGKKLDDVIESLEKNYCPSWQENHWLAGELILTIRNGRTEIGGITMRYSKETGLEQVNDGQTI